jgi:16S rRNA (cytidine1402-2'-O)-methyltransferase
MPSSPPNKTGTLFLVGTPIGNLEDITLRAIRTLGEVDLVACEDTRHTQILLTHFQIRTPTISYHEHNEMTRAPELVLRLEEGEHIALVSDAGMPGISDPGHRLVALCIRHGIEVQPVPGPSAFLASLIAGGLPTQPFRFSGFLPPKKGQRRKELESLKDLAATLVFYEAPHRILETLEDIADILGDRMVVVAREVTKIHEEFLRGTCREVLEELQRRDKVKGEITLIVDRPHPEDARAAAATKPLRQRVEELMKQKSLRKMDALKAAAKERGISKRQAYEELEQDDE